jgi:hypothetical protein
MYFYTGQRALNWSVVRLRDSREGGSLTMAIDGLALMLVNWPPASVCPSRTYSMQTGAEYS